MYIRANDLYIVLFFNNLVFVAKNYRRKNNTNPLSEFVLLSFGEQNNASIDLNYIISNSLQRMVVQKKINRIDFFVAVF